MIYNQTINYLNLPKELRTLGNWMFFAKHLFASNKEVEKLQWLSEIPYQIKKMAVSDAFDALSTNIKKTKVSGKPFELGFRSRKNPVQSMFIPKSALKSDSIFVRLLGKMNISEELPENFKDLRLIKEHNQWFIKVPFTTKIVLTESQGKTIALDQGLRTFLTGFSETEVIKIGDKCLSRITRLCIAVDKLISKIKLLPETQKRRSKKVCKYRKAISKMKVKIGNLIDELHFKSINYIVTNYDIILLPHFNVSDMVSKTRRKLKSKSVRQMMNLRFYQFAQRLVSKAEVLGKQVIRMSEAWTSKTVSWNGELDSKLGSAKKIKSEGVTMDRDINGARGIFLKALVDSPSFLQESALSSNLIKNG